MITLTAKLYQGTDWVTEPAHMTCSVEHAAHMLAGWTRMYSRPEAISAGPQSAKFWFRDANDYNLLVIVEGASVADLRAAYREQPLIDRLRYRVDRMRQQTTESRCRVLQHH